MAGLPEAAGVREASLLPGYFFFGEETLLADEFVDGLKQTLQPAQGEEFHLTRFYLDESPWSEVLDAARTAPFLFNPWRIIVVRMPEKSDRGGKGGGKKDDADSGEGAWLRHLTVADQKALRAYFAEPAGRTVLIVIQPGRARKNDTVVRFFSSLPKTAVQVREMRPPGEREVKRRADEIARGRGKTLTEAAKSRLYEIIGPDLRLLRNEIEKLAIFTGERRGIEEDDVNEATAWLRSFENYALDDVLSAADFPLGVSVLRRLFEDGERPEQIVFRLTVFFRNILAAQTWLREKGKDKKEVFREFFPNIPETYGDLYRRKFEGFFGAVQGLSRSELNAVLRRLRRVDARLKSTDDSPETTLEAFLREYCLLRKEKRPISAD